MTYKVFLDELINSLSDENTNVLNLNFNKDYYKLLGALKDFKTDKLIISLSQSFLNSHLGDLSIAQNYLNAMISLPIYSNKDNIVLLVLSSDKNSPKVLLIDESDSLIHKTDIDDWSFIKDELIEKITKIYSDFTESDSSIILEFSDIIGDFKKTNSIDNELLSLKRYDDNFPRKNRIIANEIADEILNLKEKQSLESQMTMHDIKSSGDFSQAFSNFSFFNRLMYSKKRQDPINLIYKNDKKLIDDVEFKKLGKIADIMPIHDKNNKDSILIATCKTCSSKIVFYNNDITDFNGEVYIELDNIKDIISKEYLYEYLNSGNGMDEILYFSKGNHYIIPENIREVKIPIPSLEEQKKIVKVSRESREFFKSVELLKKEFNSNILDYKHMKESLKELKGDVEIDSETHEVTKMSRSWRHAYKGLIWPLAISYLSATKGGFESVEKKDNYLVLFEFIAAFNSIILLSGLPQDVYEKNFNEIWNADIKEYKKMTFANWVYLSKNLSKVYKFNNFTSALDEELFNKISSDKILNILEEAKDIRNEEAHGSHSNAFEAEKIIDKLDVYLDDVFDILEIYSNYKLIYVTGDVKASRQAYSHRVILLNGPCAQPIYDNLTFDTILFTDCLYLYNPKNNKKLLIKENLMKFRPTDKNKTNWALFVYYSCDKGEYNAFYKCFQSDETDLKESISSLKRDVLL